MFGRASKARSLRGSGSVFVKSLRDSRRAILIACLGLGFTVWSIGISTASNYPTLASRQQQLASLQASPAFGSLFGLPIGTDTLGGMVCWRDGMFAAILLALWSITALSGTLAAEARCGALEILASTPISRRRIAVEKVASHLAGVAIVVVATSAVTWATGALYAVLPGDSMSFWDALAYFAAIALLALLGGSIALALSPLLGRGASAGAAAAVFFVMYLAYAYGDLVPALGAIKGLSPFTWTARHQPLAGSWDVLPLLPLALLVLAFLVAGIVIFGRRDIGATERLPVLALPGRRFLLRGPARQVFLRSRTLALVWGLAMGGLFGLFAAGSQSLAVTATSDPGSQAFVKAVFGDTDWTSAKGLMQLAFVWLGYVAVAVAATTLVRELASDERERRLEMLLAAPVSRVRWLLSGGLGVFAAVALMSLTMAALIGLGVAASGQDPFGPFAGAWVAGLYAAALAGVALACLGLGGVELAPAIPASLGIGFFAFDTFGSLLGLPSAVTSLSLTHHLGRPMAGSYDWPGMAMLAALAVGGVALGAWSMSRRDVSR
jgi:ABC-2 type transport system permease protein